MPIVADLCDPESILIAREINLDAVEPQRARHSGAKLTDDQVLAIRASDIPNRKLAAQYGVGRSIISDVKLRKTYKNVRETANVLHTR
jgi:hypothetical protein